ncbi:hypothetical protein B4U79_14112, partial [Dinothrombium tinctorium]
LAKINAYDNEGRIRDSKGEFISNSSLIQLLSHAMTASRILLAEKEFIDLLYEADVDPDLIINDNVKMNKDNLDLLYELYYNPKEPSCFSSDIKLYNAARLKSPTITLNDVKNWLSSQI